MSEKECECLSRLVMTPGPNVVDSSLKGTECIRSRSNRRGDETGKGNLPM